MLTLPEADGTLTTYEPRKAPRVFTPDSTPFRTRTVLASTHVVGDPLAANEPFGPPIGPPPPQQLDWEATMAFRRYLWSYGFTLCEGMDTAHRGMGLDWPGAAELIRRSGAEARAEGGRIAAAVLTDQLDPTGSYSLKEVQAAYEEQLSVVEEAGAQPIIMCSAELAAAAQTPEDYAQVYGDLIRQSSQPVVLHWILSEWMPQHTGYWGHVEFDAAYDALINLVQDNIDKVDGVKMAPAPVDRQAGLRARLPKGVRFYTSDTDHYPEMMVGDGEDYSHGLTPVFDGVIPVAAEAMRALDAGDNERGRELLDSTLELNQHLFTGAPTRSVFFFKTGLVFLGWLAGQANHFRMVWGEQSARSVPHLATAYRLADQLGVFPDPDLAAHRMKTYLATCGIGS